MLVGIVFIAIGIFMLLRPKSFYKITEKWKDSTNNEPSELYVISTRVGGCAFVVIGIVSVFIN